MKHIIDKSFLNGLARTLDISGVYFATSPIRRKYISESGNLRSSRLLSRRPDLVDSRSIRSDFEAIGNDFKSVIHQYKKDRQTI
ncbi:hypothetical protein [Synechocystis sp. PCC 6714]|uniref:hypothetical protein n=1 Tax=Synechocystis sp. (strain PCC 6714) TaxID=1147 RepID=UPI0011873976|nr:hypothetical protein [Synechocystis sp. PCC 6714]